MPTTLVNLPQATFVGPFSSVPTPGAVQLPADCVSITCDLQMPDADRADARNSVTWSVYVSTDGVTGWVPLYGPDAWTGGTHTDKFSGLTVANQSQFTYAVSPDHRGQFLKAEGAVNRRQTLGCTVVSNP